MLTLTVEMCEEQANWWMDSQENTRGMFTYQKHPILEKLYPKVMQQDAEWTINRNLAISMACSFLAIAIEEGIDLDDML